MARRRSAPVEVQPGPEVPERLRRCDVEDWVSADEVADVRAKLAGDTINARAAAGDVQQVSWELQARARSRVRDARRRWAAENGLDANEAHRLIIAGGWPTYRNESVFIAEIRKAIAGRQ